jgi:hypothetical protein
MYFGYGGGGAFAQKKARHAFSTERLSAETAKGK